MIAAFTRTRWAAAPPVEAALLIRRIAKGDHFAMRMLFGRHRIPLYRWLLRLVGARCFWKFGAELPHSKRALRWLLAIARHKALSARRHRTDAVPDEEAAPRVADGAHNSELTLQKKDRAELLRDSLVRLSPAHGEVINLVYYHGKSVKEVAEIVGVAEATLKMRMFYARQELAGLVAMA